MNMYGQSSCIVEPTNYRWIACVYNGKPRIGLDLGDDSRPGTNNRVVLTLDGIRTFKKDGMIGLRDVTTLGD